MLAVAGRKKPKPAEDSSAATGPVAPTFTDVFNQNNMYWLALKRNIDTVLAELPTLKGRSALGIAEGGCQEPFNAEHCQQALANTPPKYCCSLSLLSVQSTYGPNAAPIAGSSITTLRQRLFASGPQPLDIVLGILVSDVAAVAAKMARSEFILTSPEE